MQTAITTDRTPNLIAAEINSIKTQTQSIVINSSIEIGRRLVEAKSMVEHGEWGKWLENSVDYSQRTAENLMKIYDQFGGNQLENGSKKAQAIANLGYTQVVALLGVPEEERENFIENNNVEDMSSRELQKAIKDLKQAQKEKLELEKKLKTAKEDAQKVTQLEKDLKLVKEQLETAEASGNDEEVKKLEEALKKAKEDLKKSNTKVKELSEQLKETPIELAAATINKIPEEVEKELIELRQKVNLHQNSESVIKYSLLFDAQVKGFQELLAALAEIEKTDFEVYEQYKHAIIALSNKMMEHLNK